LRAFQECRHQQLGPRLIIPELPTIYRMSIRMITYHLDTSLKTSALRKHAAAEPEAFGVES
jgi:hypothetical protein